MFNQNKNIGVIRANSPETLAMIIGRIGGPFELLGFGNDQAGAFTYYRTTDGMKQRVLKEIAVLSSFGGENNEQGDDLKTL